MFELIDASAVTANRALPDWLGQRIRNNTLSLSDRGPGGGYVWSVQGVFAPPIGAPQPALASPVSTHPDYWYSIPFIVAPSPFQTNLRIIVQGIPSGPGVRVRLWCEGVASASSPAWATGTTRTLSVAIPRNTSTGADLRCALLVQSLVGDLDGTAPLVTAQDLYLEAGTATAPNDWEAAHKLVELTSAGGGSELRGLQGQTRYHVIRYRDMNPNDRFTVWPSPDRNLVVGGSVTGVTASVYALGTLTLASIQVATTIGRIQGIPDVSATSPSQYVRANWLATLARAVKGLLLQPQYAWIGGVGGVDRSTGTGSLGQTTIPYRLWGAQVRRDTSPVVVLRTAVRAREGVAGIILSIMYQSAATVSVTVEFDGTASTTTELGGSPATATDRDQSSESGTLHWRHKGYTRDQCSSQDLGLHGTEVEAYDCDTARLTMATIVVPWPDGYTPTVGAIVRVEVSAVSTDAYIAAQTVRELVFESTGLPLSITPPIVAPLQEIVAASFSAMRDRLNTAYARLVRCVYSEWGDPLGSFQPAAGTTGVVSIEYRTSPDLPAGTVLRMTSDAEATAAGTLTLVLGNGVGTATSVHGARGVLVANLAIASNTVYTLTITATAAGVGAIGNIYLLRIEEVTP